MSEPHIAQQLSTEQLTRIAVAALEDIKAKDITVLEVGHLSSLFETMIIASGDSNRQVRSLADNVQKKLKEAGASIIGNIRVGDYAKVGSGSVVTKPVPDGCTAVGVPAQLINCPTCGEPSKSMDQTINPEDLGNII